MHKKLRVPKRDGTKPKKDKIDWDYVREIIGLIVRAGGEVVNRHGAQRTFQLPKKPGIKILGYGDCLIRAGFTRIYSPEEVVVLAGLRRLGARF